MVDGANREIFGSEGDDTLAGDGPYDAVFGGGGNDELSSPGTGGAIWGGEGDDRISGSPGGFENLYGDGGADRFALPDLTRAAAFGGEGDDLFEVAERFSGLIVGGDGVDVLALEGDAADYRLRTDGIQHADGSAFLNMAGIEIVRFADGDVLLAERFPGEIRDFEGLSISGATVTFVGTDARDSIWENRGDATDLIFYGGGGNDNVRLESGEGQHRIWGGEGDDRIDAQGWDTRIYGGEGDDVIAAGYGQQVVDGGAGRDVVDYGSRSMDEYSIEILGVGAARISWNVSDFFRISYAWVETEGVELLRFKDGEISLSGVPVTDAERFEAVEGGPTLRIAAAELLEGDVDPLGGPLTLVAVRDAVGGTVALTAGGEVRFAPLPGFHGEASFDYVVAGQGGESVQQVIVDVASTNRAPVAADDVFAGAVGGHVSGDLLADNGAGPDRDPDGDALRVANIDGTPINAFGRAVVTLAHGVVVQVDWRGLVEWDLSSVEGVGRGETVEVSFSYVLADPETALDTGRATLTLSGPPAAVRGGGGSQRLAGTAADDLIYGGRGDDVLLGRVGDDRLFGGGQRDLLKGGADDDALRGGGGSDRLDGGEGDDVLRGGLGRDKLVGGAGDDRLAGGGGGDRFLFRPGDGADVLVDFDPARDVLALRGFDPDAGLAVVDDGADALIVGQGVSIRLLDVSAAELAGWDLFS
ncbi:Ig-like domain-containing protein [Albimonas pacifica]|uniref:Hemolysin-type calcium-binding repeat-containing protein n=1 Tax=Albimonas pacifica TaxID=1114924 RepID=A0A1I3N5P3_9RHOB|nr:Ig-like domain-containing protein [Albimonas pacifica]SFJ04512.1 Hemolysin-type calcium-binding repeat-containing protein [Albimonas pacifica]